jgi:hypothetical protein
MLNFSRQIHSLNSLKLRFWRVTIAITETTRVIGSIANSGMGVFMSPISRVFGQSSCGKKNRGSATSQLKKQAKILETEAR